VECVWKRKSAAARRKIRQVQQRKSALLQIYMDPEDETKLRTWRKLIVDVPIDRILPRDVSFGPGIERDGDAAERLAFFGDKYLNLSVALALENQLAENGETMSVGEMSVLCSSARSNMLFAKLLPKLLTPDMVAAVPEEAIVEGRQHSVGTLLESCAYLVRTEGGEEGAAAVDELGAFLLEEAEKQAEDVHNYKGALYELIAKGVDGHVVTVDKMGEAMSGEASHPQRFESQVELDGVRATFLGRNKREAERGAAKNVLEKLFERERQRVLSGEDLGSRGGSWQGTPERPVPPPLLLRKNQGSGSFDTMDEDEAMAEAQSR